MLLSSRHSPLKWNVQQTFTLEHNFDSNFFTKNFPPFQKKRHPIKLIMHRTRKEIYLTLTVDKLTICLFPFVKVIWIYALASVRGNPASWLETFKPDKLCAPVDTKGLAFKFNLCGKSSQFGLIFYFSDKLCALVDTRAGF